MSLKDITLKRGIFYFLFLVLFVSLIVIVVFWSNYNSVSETSMQGTTVEIIPSQKVLLRVANQSSSVTNMLSKGGEIIVGPKKVTEFERSKLKAIFEEYSDPIYYMQIQNLDLHLLVVLNGNEVLKTIPITKFDFG